MEAPFTETLLRYEEARFPFRSILESILVPKKTEGESSSAAGSDARPLEQLHQDYGPRRRSAGGTRRMPGLNDEFFALYRGFVRDVIRPHLGEEFVLYERCPNLRVALAGAKALTPPHVDADYGHSGREINFWFPATRVDGASTLWMESVPGRGDFRPICAGPGEAIRFYGNQCLHFTKDNDSDRTRVSFDFRIVRARDFRQSGIPVIGDPKALSISDCGALADPRWDLFGYYGLMGPSGDVSAASWALIHESVCAMPQGLPAQVQAEQVQESCLEVLHTEKVQEQRRPRRPRSTSAEHRAACIERWGGERAARKSCARCGWLANRAELCRTTLTYVTASGENLPWIAENTDPLAPWGLGCVLCSAARSQGGDLGALVPRSAFADFSYGPGLPGLLVQPLARHGNHALRQSGNYSTKIATDRGHEAAAADAASGTLQVQRFPR